MYKKSKSKYKHIKLSPELAFDVCDYFTEDTRSEQTGKFITFNEE